MKPNADALNAQAAALLAEKDTVRMPDEELAWRFWAEVFGLDPTEALARYRERAGTNSHDERLALPGWRPTVTDEEFVDALRRIAASHPEAVREGWRDAESRHAALSDPETRPLRIIEWHVAPHFSGLMRFRGSAADALEHGIARCGSALRRLRGAAWMRYGDGEEGVEGHIASAHDEERVASVYIMDPDLDMDYPWNGEGLPEY